MCEKDQYIVQIKPTVKFDELGIESLRIKCATKDGYIPSNEYVGGISCQKCYLSPLTFPNLPSCLLILDSVDKFHDVVSLLAFARDSRCPSCCSFLAPLATHSFVGANVAMVG